MQNNPLSNPIGSYEKNEIIEILEEDRGVYRTKEGFINKNFLAECKPINTPSSMAEGQKVETPSSNNDTTSSSEENIAESSPAPESYEGGTEVDKNIGRTRWQRPIASRRVTPFVIRATICKVYKKMQGTLC